MDLERLDEALTWDTVYVDAIGRGDPDLLFEPLEVIVDAARAYRDLLANGERMEPDYERAKRQMLNYLDDELFLGLESELGGIVDWIWLTEAVVDAAIGDRLLVDPPTEEDT